MSIAESPQWRKGSRTWGRSRDVLAAGGLLVPVVGAAIILFLVAPWPLATKSLAALHGLCAQRPSHSLWFGDRRLPFDARMTGIYGGFVVSSIYLLARGRTRAFRLPSRWVILLLAGFVALLGIDGVNSTLVDLRFWHPYQPSNTLRLATGLLTGISLATMLCFVLGTTLWRRGNMRQPVVTGPGELLLMAGLDLPLALLALTGWPWLYLPLTMLLVIGAAAVMGTMCLVVVVLIKYSDRAFDTFQQVTTPATAAFLLGLLCMALLAGGRFWLEHITHAPPLV